MSFRCALLNFVLSENSWHACVDIFGYAQLSSTYKYRSIQEGPKHLTEPKCNKYFASLGISCTVPIIRTRQTERGTLLQLRICQL